MILNMICVLCIVNMVLIVACILLSQRVKKLSLQQDDIWRGLGSLITAHNSLARELMRILGLRRVVAAEASPYILKTEYHAQRNILRELNELNQQLFNLHPPETPADKEPSPAPATEPELEHVIHFHRRNNCFRRLYCWLFGGIATDHHGYSKI